MAITSRGAFVEDGCWSFRPLEEAEEDADDDDDDDDAFFTSEESSSIGLLF